MATLKLSQIALALSPPALTDTVVGVGGGITDLQYTISQLSSTLAVPVGANPTATASNIAVNGSAATFMRSDGAPAIQLTSSSVFGLCKVDGTTITASGGVISSVGGAASLVIGTTTITGGVAGGILYDSGPGILEESSKWTFNGTNTVSLNGGIAIINLPSTSNFFDGGAGNTTVTGTGNFGTGASALPAVSTGSFNMAVGVNALGSVGTGSSNVGIGNAAGQGITADQCVAMGTSSLSATNTCSGTIGIGFRTLANTTAGNHDIAIGNSAMSSTSGTGGANVGIGANTLVSVTGSGNTGIGDECGESVTSGNSNTFIGQFSGISTTGSSNTLIGASSGQSITTGGSNSMLGTAHGTAAMANCIVLSDGAANIKLDYNFTGANKWTLQTALNLAYVSNSGILVTDSSGNVTENNNTAAATVTANFTADHRLQVTLGGTTYYLAASTTAW